MSCRRVDVLAAWTIFGSVLLLLALPVSGLGQGRQVHGESSSFTGHGVAIVWGVLRGPSEEDTRVVLRIAPAGGGYAAVSVDGVDPFSQRRQALLRVQPFESSVDVRTPRVTFADLPRREIHFYTAVDRDAQRPSLTVYFLGLPDTTPEFVSEAALRAYLEDALAKLPGR
jgi:hypothetical protein